MPEGEESEEGVDTFSFVYLNESWAGAVVYLRGVILGGTE